jgi:hypothetical protein
MMLLSSWECLGRYEVMGYEEMGRWGYEDSEQIIAEFW